MPRASFRPPAAVLVAAAAALAAVLAAPALSARPGELVRRFNFAALAPQDIAWDGEVYYITTFLDERILRYSADLRTRLEPLVTPFDTGLGMTGIAYVPRTRTLWVAEPQSREIREVDLQGGATGRVLAPAFQDVVNAGASPVPRGMAHYPRGDGGQGSLFIVESLGSIVYEVAIDDGEVLGWFPHFEDPDGFPGRGASVARFTDVDLVLDEGGSLTGFYVNSGKGQQDWIRRLELDGSYTGFSIPLTAAGGSVAGFLVKDFPGTDGAPISPAVIATVESSAKIAVLDGSEPTIGDLFGLTCAVAGRKVDLSWKSGSHYDRVELYRDCELRASFANDPGSASEAGVGPGAHLYHLVGYLSGESVRSGECLAVVEGGRVLRSTRYEGKFPVDLAVDENGFVYVSDYYDRNVHVFSPRLEFQSTIELPFFNEEDRLSGLAYNPNGGTLFIYTQKTDTIVEADLTGSALGAIDVQLPNDPADPADKALVGGLSFDPLGGPDRLGAFWLVELVRETVYQVGLDGAILHRFLHPAAAELPLPEGAPFSNQVGGLAEVPGLGFDFLDLTSGTLFEGQARRIIRVDARTGQPVPGAELTLAAQIREAPAVYVGIQHWARPDGTPVLLVAAAAGNPPLILELDPTLPQPRPITRLTARPVGRGRDVTLAFEANDAYERIRILRDCRPHRELVAGEFVPGRVEVADRDVPAGFHRYDVRGVKGGIETSTATAQVQVGPAAILDRRFSFPDHSPIQLSRDPTDGSYLAASNSPRQVRSLFRYRPDLTYEETLEEAIPAPWEAATVGIRPGATGESIIHVIAWTKPAQLGAGPTSFPMFVLSRDGKLLREIPIKPPVPANGFVVYPTGLSWDPLAQVFYYLERNSETIVRMDADGNTLTLIRHPAPPAQSFVFNVGLCLDAENGALYVTSAGPDDRRITRALQLTPAGRLTGLELSLANLPLNPIHGIAIDGPDLVTSGYSAAGELFRLQWFHEVPPPRGLTCSARGAGALLRWEPAGAYDRVVVLRDGKQIALLPGSAVSYVDAPVDRRAAVVYSVAGQVGDGTGKNRFCELPALPAGFIRGDANGTDGLELTDAILVLSHLFLSGPPPACDDAADADDSGSLNITDPVRILGRLFLGAEDLPQPYPDAGQDPTADDLSCS